MHISSKQIVKRMEKEISVAKQNVNNRVQLLQSIAKIKLLCELIEDASGEKITIMEEDPIVKLMNQGDQETEDPEHDPSSIFDF